MQSKRVNKQAAVLLPAAVVVLCAFILLYPREMTEAARGGVGLWFNGVLPALLPFVVGVNLLVALGAVRFMGVLLNPVMRPLFGVPGSGAFAFLAGVMSGSPVGVKVTCELRESGAISRIEGQRLLAFAGNCGPLFILGTIGGMLGNMAAAWFILMVHVFGAVVTGLLFKSYGKSEDEQAKQGEVVECSTRMKNGIIKEAFRAMMNARREDGRGFGQVLTVSVKQAMHTLFVIGGFVILFSVVSTALELAGVFAVLAGAAAYAAPLSAEFLEGIFTGVLEMANGAAAICEYGCTEFGSAVCGGKRLILLTLVGVVSWGGFSVHAQAAGFMAKTDLRFGVYLFAKVIHVVVAIGLGVVLIRFL